MPGVLATAARSPKRTGGGLVDSEVVTHSDSVRDNSTFFSTSVSRTEETALYPPLHAFLRSPREADHQTPPRLAAPYPPRSYICPAAYTLLVMQRTRRAQGNLHDLPLRFPRPANPRDCLFTSPSGGLSLKMLA